MEEWKRVDGFENYEVSTLGNVRRIEHDVVTRNRWGEYRLKIKEGVCRGSLNCDGYRLVSLRNGNKQKDCFVHVLVARAFIPNPENKPFVDHINTIRDDNRVENLRWVTAQENQNNPISLQNMSRAQKKLIKEHPERLKILNKTGFKFSEESIKKLSESHKGYVWSEESKRKLVQSNQGKFNSKKVAQYTADGQFIRVFSSITQAAKAIGRVPTAIINHLRGEAKLCNGFIFKRL